MAAVSSRLRPYKRCQLATGQPPRQAELAAMTDAVCQMASLKKSEKREDESAAQL
jgi:alpha-D-ribose 1-methylphosphonate 5-triphosphate synthase subunit PhnG